MSADAVFTKLSLVYGKRFIESLGGADPTTVRAHWAHELRGYSDGAIAHGLANLPQSFVPNVLQFAAVCRQWTPPSVPRLDPPKANPEAVARARRRIEGVAQRMQGHVLQSKAWAERLRMRHERGDRLSRFQVECYERVLGKGGSNADAMGTPELSSVDGQAGAA